MTITHEHSIEAHFVKRVQELGGFSLKTDRVPGRRFLDRTAFLPGGVVIVAELKRPRGGRYSAHQLATIKMLEDMGHKVWKLHTKDAVDTALRTVPEESAK